MIYYVTDGIHQWTVEADDPDEAKKLQRIRAVCYSDDEPDVCEAPPDVQMQYNPRQKSCRGLTFEAGGCMMWVATNSNYFCNGFFCAVKSNTLIRAKARLCAIRRNPLRLELVAHITGLLRFKPLEATQWQ